MTFHVIEGSDGMGKTSVGEKLVELYGVSYLETPGQQFRSLNGKPQTEFPGRLDYFMRGNIFAAEQLPSKEVGILGRYCASTAIGCVVMFGTPIEDAKRMIQEYRAPREERTILLTADEDEQIRRIVARNGHDLSYMDDVVVNHIERRKLMNGLYLDFAKEEGWHVIDTTRKSVNEIVSEAAEVMGL